MFTNTVLGRPAGLFRENNVATLKAAIDLNSLSRPVVEGAMAVVAQGTWRREVKGTGGERQGGVGRAKHYLAGYQSITPCVTNTSQRNAADPCDESA